MSTRISHIPFYRRLFISDFRLLAAAVVYAVPVVALLIWKPYLGVIAAAAPLGLLLAAHGPSAIYVLVIATFAFLPISKQTVILPADMAAFVLTAAYIIDLLLNRSAPGKNRLARPYLLYLAVLFIALALEGFTSISLKYYVRQLLLAASFFAIAHFGQKMKAVNILNLFLITAVLNSIYSLYQFLAAGGGIRTFGIGGLGYGDHAMLAVCIGSVFYLWSRDTRKKILYGAAVLIAVGALAATQTRASAITAGWSLVIIVGLSLMAGRRIGDSTPRKNLLWAFGLALLIIPILAIYTPIFEGVAYRFGRIGLHASGTILLRMSLWKAALGAFWNNPFFGIGPGNFPMVIDWVPEVRFDYIFYMVSGLSTHSVLMTALAETGIIGLFVLTFFFTRSFLVARKNFLYTKKDRDLPVTISLLVATAAILGSSLYAGSWFWGSNSYHMAIVFGLTAAYRRN